MLTFWLNHKHYYNKLLNINVFVFLFLSLFLLIYFHPCGFFMSWVYILTFVGVWFFLDWVKLCHFQRYGLKTLFCACPWPSYHGWLSTAVWSFLQPCENDSCKKSKISSLIFWTYLKKINLLINCLLQNNTF